MFKHCKRSASLPFALTLISTLFLGTAAMAGGCPAGNVVDKDGQKPGATVHKGVEETVLGFVNLSNEKVHVAGRMLRLRRLIIQPGGEVAWHSHADRPALIYVTEGAITEYSSHCSVPIEHKAGDLSVESGGLSHWWKNNSDKPVTLLSSDLAATPDEHNM